VATDAAAMHEWSLRVRHCLELLSRAAAAAAAAMHELSLRGTL
jgi:hypothetical protein